MISSDDNHRWQLRPIRIASMAECYSVLPEGVTVGRGPDCGIRVSDVEFGHVSTTHCRFAVRDEDLILEDLGSKNGTFVNDERIEQKELRDGDVVELGPGGPRFRISDSTAAPRTMSVNMQVPRPKKEKFGEGTIMSMKAVLGIPDKGVADTLVVEGRKRRRSLAMVVTVLLVIIGGVSSYMLWEMRETAKKYEAFAELTEQREKEQQNLSASQQQFQEVYERLGDLAKNFEVLKEGTPAGLEAVRAARKAVVFVEMRWYYRDVSSGKFLWQARGRYNTDNQGSIVFHDDTGSGFCVSPEGYVMTNAHVVVPEQSSITLPDGTKFKAEVQLKVVFTGGMKRIDAATVVTDELQDLALLKIQPFENMPVIAGFSLDEPVPEIFDEVFLFGFPLGKHAIAMDAGTNLEASSFRGVYSRFADPYLQVDSAVHPGNSGGPVVNSAGKVVGVVVGVQNTPDGATAPSMGFVIPIQVAKSIWPPPTP